MIIYVVYYSVSDVIGGLCGTLILMLRMIVMPLLICLVMLSLVVLL